MSGMGQSGDSPIFTAEVSALLRRHGYNPENVAEVEVRTRFYGHAELGYVKLKPLPTPPEPLVGADDEHTPRGLSGDPPLGPFGSS